MLLLSVNIFSFFDVFSIKLFFSCIEAYMNLRPPVLLLLVVLVAAECAEDAAAQLPTGSGMGEPAMAAEQSPDAGVGMQRAIAQLQQDMKEAREESARLRDVINVLMQDMKEAREESARLRDVINVLMQGAAAKGPRPEQNELHVHELEQKKWHEMSEARLRSVEKTVKFPFDLGRKPITVVPGRASGQWWDEVEAGKNV